MYTYSFEKLQVWKEAKEFTILIYKVTSKFPNEERFGLTSQLRRASVSICSNIAEGSAVEVLNQLIISKELGFTSEEKYIEFRSKIESITNKLSSLRNYQKNE